MIQRKQTIWLLINIILLVAMVFIPFGHQATLAPTSTAVTTIDLTMKFSILLLIVSAIAIATAGFAIFMFKNRAGQKLLCILNIFICLGIAGYEFFVANNKAQNYVLSFGIALPILAALFSIMAWSGVQADEKLIKSVDRLRD